MASVSGGFAARCFTFLFLCCSIKGSAFRIKQKSSAIHDRGTELKQFELSYSASGAPTDAGYQKALIPGSSHWFTCWKRNMHRCGRDCCCDAGSWYTEGKCEKVEGGRIKGWMPRSGSNLPVFVWLTGTTVPFWSDSANQVTKEMAKRGYIAAEVEYDNSDMLGYIRAGCEGVEDKANVIFGHSGSRDATYGLCAKEQANCSNGIAVAGWSQGAQIASLAAHFNSNVSALLSFAQGSRDKFKLVDLPCLRNPGNKVKRLQIISEDDNMFGEPLKEQKETSGYDCGDDYHCIQADGSGYYVMKASERGDSVHGHGFLMKQPSFTSNFKSNWKFTANFKSTTAPWGMKSTLDWLAKAARKLG